MPWSSQHYHCMTAQEYIIMSQQHPFFFCFPAVSLEFSFMLSLFGTLPFCDSP